jgi:hypothetical protein
MGTLPPHAVTRPHFCSDMRVTLGIPQTLAARPPEASAMPRPPPAHATRPPPVRAARPPVLPRHVVARTCLRPTSACARRLALNASPGLRPRLQALRCPTTGPLHPRPVTGSLTPGHRSSCSLAWPAPPHPRSSCSPA